MHFPEGSSFARPTCPFVPSPRPTPTLKIRREREREREREAETLVRSSPPSRTELTSPPSEDCVTSLANNRRERRRSQRGRPSHTRARSGKERERRRGEGKGNRTCGQKGSPLLREDGLSNVRATNLLAANSNRARARFDLGHRAPHGVNWQNLGSGDVARLSSTTERGREGGRGRGDGNYGRIAD